MLKHTLKRSQASNDFKVSVSDSDWTQEWMDIISNQVVSTKMNFVDRTVQLNVRQLATGHIQDLIFHILQREYQEIDEIRVRPAKRQAYEYVFTKGKLIDHGVGFSYNETGAVVHRLLFQFTGLSLLSKEGHAIEASVKLPEPMTENLLTD